MLTRRNDSILWLALVLLAAFLRLAPIGAGLPYIDYVDEGYALHQAIHLLNQRTFDTEWYGYPSLPAYLTAAAMTAWKPVYRNVHGHHFRNDLPSEDAARTTSGYNYDLISPPELILAGRGRFATTAFLPGFNCWVSFDAETTTSFESRRSNDSVAVISDSLSFQTDMPTEISLSTTVAFISDSLMRIRSEAARS